MFGGAENGERRGEGARCQLCFGVLIFGLNSSYSEIETAGTERGLVGGSFFWT